MYPSISSEFRLRTPFGAVIVGPTMSGKSVFTFNLLRNRDKMMDNPPDRIVYCYGAWQKGFEELQNEKLPIEFFKGLREVFTEEGFFDPNQKTLLILDDLAADLADHKEASQLFTQGIHHKNISVILIMQNLFKQGKSMRDIHLNCQYLILFKNCRDVNQIKLLARQMGLPHLVDAYNKVTSVAYQPIIVDMKPDTPDYLRVRSHIQPGELLHIYVDKKNSKLPCRNVPSN
jgi:hypothetical protein